MDLEIFSNQFISPAIEQPKTEGHFLPSITPLSIITDAFQKYVVQCPRRSADSLKGRVTATARDVIHDVLFKEPDPNMTALLGICELILLSEDDHKEGLPILLMFLGDLKRGQPQVEKLEKALESGLNEESLGLLAQFTEVLKKVLAKDIGQVTFFKEELKAEISDPKYPPIIASLARYFKRGSKDQISFTRVRYALSQMPNTPEIRAKALLIETTLKTLQKVRGTETSFNGYSYDANPLEDLGTKQLNEIKEAYQTFGSTLTGKIVPELVKDGIIATVKESVRDIANRYLPGFRRFFGK